MCRSQPRGRWLPDGRDRSLTRAPGPMRLHEPMLPLQAELKSTHHERRCPKVMTIGAMVRRDGPEAVHHSVLRGDRIAARARAGCRTTPVPAGRAAIARRDRNGAAGGPIAVRSGTAASRLSLDFWAELVSTPSKSASLASGGDTRRLRRRAHARRRGALATPLARACSEAAAGSPEPAATGTATPRTAQVVVAAHRTQNVPCRHAAHAWRRRPPTSRWRRRWRG